MTQDLRTILETLLGPNPPETLLVQIERVLAWKPSEKQRQGLRSELDVVAAFREKGLIPPRLLNCIIQNARPDLLGSRAGRVSSADRIAVCFAACAYPRRAFQMVDTILGLRVKAFLEVWPALMASVPAGSGASGAVPLGFLPRGRFPGSFSPHAIEGLLSDLSAVEAHVHPMQERQRRRVGAVLYVSTCYPDLISRICESWRSEAGLVRYVQKWLSSTPSCMVREDTREDRYSEGWPERVESGLAGLNPTEPHNHHKTAVILEQMTRNKVREWRRFGEVWDLARGFWETQWGNLISGFPYYAFSARFVYWWKQCLANYRPPGLGEIGLDEEYGELEQRGPTSPVTPKSHLVHLGADQLRLFRENYRFVRTTFFRRTDMMGGRAGEPVDPAAQNARLRQALDVLWYERLENKISADLPPELIRKIAARFPELGHDAINNYNFRLRLRVWACALARFRNLRNWQILTAPRPPEYARLGAKDQPFKDEPGILTIATLARIIPPGHTLLWAFTAHVFLHPKVEPQRADPWTFKRYLRELWRWVTEETFESAVRRGAEDGGRADQAALSALKEAPWESLLRDLRRQETAEALERYLSGREFQAECAAALRIVERLVGSGGLRACSEESLRTWRAPIVPHWIVPVWYLTFVERLEGDALVERLRVDRHEVEAVLGLSKAMAACAAGKTSLPVQVRVRRTSQRETP